MRNFDRHHLVTRMKMNECEAVSQKPKLSSFYTRTEKTLHYCTPVYWPYDVNQKGYALDGEQLNDFTTTGF